MDVPEGVWTSVEGCTGAHARALMMELGTAIQGREWRPQGSRPHLPTRLSPGGSLTPRTRIDVPCVKNT
jgi:hypothetical protein